MHFAGNVNGLKFSFVPTKCISSNLEDLRDGIFFNILPRHDEICCGPVVLSNRNDLFIYFFKKCMSLICTMHSISILDVSSPLCWKVSGLSTASVSLWPYHHEQNRTVFICKHMKFKPASLVSNCASDANENILG